MQPLDRLLQEQLDLRRAAGQLRCRRLVEPIDSTHITVADRRCVNFSSNDYLGLTHHPRILRAVADAALHFGAGAGASPLVTGHSALHAQAEAAIARWKATDAAILMPSGYQAAHGVIQALLPLRPRFLIDKLSHASLIDALAPASFRVFPHNNLEKLRRLLENADPMQPQVVITESIFSMDGDAADLPGLAQFKAQYPFVLVLDEAHASGIYGRNGAGYANELNLASIVDVSIVTLSKALGLAGGAICGSQTFCDSVLNWGRACIYSTAIAPMVAAAVPVAIDILRTEPHRQQRVRELARCVRRGIPVQLRTCGGEDSPIIPIILGCESAAVNASKHLLEQGLLVPPIRPPTVPRDTSRLRVSLSSDHSDGEIDRLIAALRDLTPDS